MDLFSDVKPTRKLREYQEKAIAGIEKLWSEGKRALLIMATGTGKTIVFSEAIKRNSNHRSLVLAHREELIDQAIEKIKDQAGRAPEKEKAFDYADIKSQIVVGSVQSMQNDRLLRWKRNNFGILVVDEAHHAVSKTYKNILEHFQEYRLLGVTATPDRADQKELGNIFDEIAFEYPMHLAIKEGHLCKIIGKKVTDFDIDLSQLRVVCGDYQEKDLALLIEKYIAPISKSIVEQSANLKTLVFMSNVESSRLMAEALSALDLKAAFISGGTDRLERREILNKFSRGVISHLVSCDVLLEGYDEPSVAAIAMCRPTGSRTVFAQAVGRGTRPYPGKDCLTLIEFTYNSSKLKLVTAYELFSTMGFGAKVQERAERNTNKKDEVDFLYELEFANHEEYSTRSIISRLAVKSFGFTTFDPMAMGDLIGIDVSGEFNITYEGRKLEGKITEKQAMILKRYGIAGVDSLQKAQASALIDGLMKKNYIPMIGEATHAQIGYLRRLKYSGPTEHMTKAQASILINEISRRGGVEAAG